MQPAAPFFDKSSLRIALEVLQHEHSNPLFPDQKSYITDSHHTQGRTGPSAFFTRGTVKSLSIAKGEAAGRAIFQ